MFAKTLLFSLILMFVFSFAALAQVGVSNLVPEKYQVGTIAVGEKYYVDRDYTVVELPDELDGITMIMTGNDEKNSTGEGFMSFDINVPATVYIAHDSRGEVAKGGVPPAWLADGFTFMDGVAIEASDANMGTFGIWKKDFNAGTVKLGGNADPPAAGQGSMYLVLLNPLDLSSVKSIGKATTTWAEIKK